MTTSPSTTGKPTWRSTTSASDRLHNGRLMTDEPPKSPGFDLPRALGQLAGHKTLLVYTHDNPDPDSLAAALGLGRLIEHELGAAVTLAQGGIVGRAQNRAMVDVLNIPLVPVEQIDPDSFDTI